MNITGEQIFKTKQELQKQIEEYEKKLQALIAKQYTLTKVEDLAKSILEYDELERQISDRNLLFALFSAPFESLRNPLVKSEFFAYVAAAETIGIDLVNFLVEDFLAQMRFDIQNGEDDMVDLIEADYKEYIIPGKIIAERFDEIEGLLTEMIRFCKYLDHKYSEERASDVLKYAFRISIDADTRMPPTIKALKEFQFTYLRPTDRAELLDHVEEHLAILRFEQVRKQNIAMEKAVAILQKREEDKEK